MDVMSLDAALDECADTDDVIALLSRTWNKLEAATDELEQARDEIAQLEEELEAKEIEILDLHREFIEEGI